MTDRELLEAAARVAGKSLISGHADDSRGVFTTLGWWNPLANDGDAFRLAVKLGLFHIYDMDTPRALIHFDTTEPDPYAATRRAIVRAAAAMGQQP